jgi:hypothetical protein
MRRLDLIISAATILGLTSAQAYSRADTAQDDMMSQLTLRDKMVASYCGGQAGLAFGQKIPEDPTNTINIKVTDCMYVNDFAGAYTRDKAALAPCQALATADRQRQCATAKGFHLDQTTGLWAR